ncbi:acetyl-CoA C-acyltransferase [Ferrovibrio sp.]|uniref:acetyl-CoA C-acyltransferase n=1 Tax=Ferrovibrio sp. TaxID=1917215 RepID=UPI000CBB5AB4|nr:acetyl-CoA C-acyltransferase [Ferrovibrio sp.]PJI42036.1 MAG: acetyl-CoA C-acyltransferase [Ferrovibrio sp.]
MSKDTPKDPIVIASAIRTPLGRFGGALSSVPGNELGAVVIREALSRAGVQGEQVDEVLMGCVLPAGQGQAPARQAARKAGLPDHVGAVTVNKVCGSGMRATMMAHDMLLAGSADLMVAGGMESMSGAPYLLPQMRFGHKAGHTKVIDHMMMDGLEDAYERDRAMGTFGEQCAEKYGFTRAEQDAYAIETLTRARNAVENGWFDAEIVAVTPQAKGTETLSRDENPLKVNPEKIPTLKAAFKANGTITPASSSANADGAAALVLARESTAKEKGLPIVARIVGHSVHAQAPDWFTTAPIPAIRKLLDKTGWTINDVDLFEINEAFAAVPMAAMRDLNIGHDRLNLLGGACALGHPIGATGARIIVTLLNTLQRSGGKRGIASLCIGGGEATAIAVELAA